MITLAAIVIVLPSPPLNSLLLLLLGVLGVLRDVVCVRRGECRPDDDAEPDDDGVVDDAEGELGSVNTVSCKYKDRIRSYGANICTTLPKNCAKNRRARSGARINNSNCLSVNESAVNQSSSQTQVGM